MRTYERKFSNDKAGSPSRSAGAAWSSPPPFIYGAAPAYVRAVWRQQRTFVVDQMRTYERKFSNDKAGSPSRSLGAAWSSPPPFIYGAAPAYVRAVWRQPGRRLVEARGVEPLSGTPFAKTSTRLACDRYFGILRLACSVVTLETCSFSAIHPVPRLHAQPVKCRLPP